MIMPHLVSETDSFLLQAQNLNQCISFKVLLFRISGVYAGIWMWEFVLRVNMMTHVIVNNRYMWKKVCHVEINVFGRCNEYTVEST